MATLLPEQEESLLLGLPTELLIAIFSAIPSFLDAVHFAQACKPVYEIWKEHLTTIYNEIAPAAIPCYQALCGLLADRGYRIPDTPGITPEDIALVVKTSRAGEKLVESYHGRMSQRPYYDPQVSWVLSRSEKIRFLRAQYQLWGLLLLSPKDQEKRIRRMNLKQTCLLSDFLCVFRQEDIDDVESQERFANNSVSRVQLQIMIRGQRNKDFRRLHGIAYRPVQFTPYEPAGRHAWWCDQQQGVFKDMVTGSLFSQDKTAQQEVKEKAIWEETSDEDFD
ncbi:hypothetical protein ARAM_003372 [Aspergillus rambellii]|uniref:F-box domain-containing protein n=2 Tax=Aspergillus subgen. Nidulantes TaxID=2720870 RepID=A0A0F8X878_9EURO|nr:hypothetical protein ARAM_003372 [Aspergillus rambellii]KKK24017.1 hypothetical protein AOCH_002779 [Aspergillus ochraceoroseus]